MGFLKKIINRIKFLKSEYINDQFGIIDRYSREKLNWDIHLQNTRQFIINNLNYARENKSVAVLGSGWLLDVPTEILSENFKSVVFFDIVQPEQIKNRITKNFKNIDLKTGDLNCGAFETACNARNFNDFCQKLNSLPFDNLKKSLEEYDLVISLNLLNQLDILLCDYLKEKFKIDNEETLLPIRKIIQQNHLDILPVNKTILITDGYQTDIDIKTGMEYSKSLIYCDLKKYNVSKTWDWIFDTHQQYNPDMNTILKVSAFLI